MVREPDEQALLARFSRRYQSATSGLMRKIERRVRGSDYGGTSWTTRREADGMGEMLKLAPGTRLLEVGAGSGWPGLYLAKVSGCDVALIDLPLQGLRIAKARAARDQLAGACGAAVADGSALPFPSGWFHAVVHSDVLCCLPRKLAVLASCRDVICADGSMVFSVILVTPGLSAGDYRQALAGGPAFIAADTTYPHMLQRTGWEITDHADLTAQFLTSVRAQLDEEEAHAEQLAKILGAEETSELLKSRRSRLAALEGGLIRRELFQAVPVA